MEVSYSPSIIYRELITNTMLQVTYSPVLLCLLVCSQMVLSMYLRPRLISSGSGMAKAVADSTEDNQGGFASNGSPISGFSHMHDSGTGGAQSLSVSFL